MTASTDLQNAKAITLPNGLRTLLFHQPDSAHCHVSMAIKAGHFFDPDECHGLAHLLEHMLFMGSRHIPQPNAINNLVERAGGSINAWTGTEFANYHFSCQQEAFDTVLPAFADMLRAPLIQPECIEKEVQAIDAEFQFKRKDDLRRLYQIHKETANPAHPFSKFSVGNKGIFSQFSPQQLHLMLKQFHQQYYTAANMCLCIIAPHEVTQLEALVNHVFNGLASGVEANLSLPPLYTESQLGVRISIRPLKAARRMIVTFALPGMHQEYNTKPLHYISHLLGDEGNGSLLCYLKQKGWVTNLIAGSGIEGENFKDFNVSFQLTEAGLQQQEAILDALFASLNKIDDSIVEAWRFREKARLSVLAQTFEESVKPLEKACDFAEQHFYFALDTLKKAHNVSNYDPDCLHRTMAYFKPANMRVKVIAPEVSVDKQCQFYDAWYSIAPIEADKLAKWSAPHDIADITLPPPNPYIGESYELCLPEARFANPIPLSQSVGLDLWYAQDQVFHTPKGDIYLSFDSEGLTGNINQVASKRLWLALLNDHLQSQFYRAEIAGLHYRIYGHQGGFSLHTRGFSHQQTKLAGQLLDAIFEYQPNANSFAQIKQLQSQSLHNALLNKPTNRLFSRLSVLIQRNTHAPIDLLSAVSDCEFEHVIETSSHAFDHFHIDGLMHGNWTSDEAQQFFTSVKQQCPFADAPAISRQVAKLPVGAPLYHELQCEHDDSAIVLYLQAPSSSIIDTAMCMILEQMLAGPFFNTLRTEKQLGYVVGTGFVPHNQHPGMAFYIQSPTHSPQVLLAEMTRFLRQQMLEIGFYQAYWPSIQRNLLKQLHETDLNLSMKSQRLWLSLGNQDLEFNRNQKLAECIANIDFSFIQSYAETVSARTSFGELVLFAPGKFDSINLTDKSSLSHIAVFKESAIYFD